MGERQKKASRKKLTPEQFRDYLESLDDSAEIDIERIFEILSIHGEVKPDVDKIKEEVEKAKKKKK